ncbi:MAG TPA: PD-(D/E)XK nuclease family protein [Spirochaetales bacterium]|nr:PD-(D/E)XK nuclease family protein [Spirochaetales bacterium]
MRSRLPEELLGELDDPSARFVFPSEIAAASALTAALAATGRRALPSRRFLGWDAFKSEVFAGDAEGRPSTKAVRAVFARALAAENARSPFLRSVIPAQSAASSLRFARSMAAALPALRAVPDGPGDHLADWREIRRRYELFMGARGLYEAAWLGRSASRPAARWVLLYPDLTEDWDDYAEAVLALPGSSAILSDRLGAEPVRAARFGTAVEEIRAVLLAIRDEVASGADPAGIVISAAAPESTLPLLEREAAVAGVPLDVREGRPLSESSGGRLLADAKALADSGMSFEALRRLLLDASIPWKEAEAARRLLAIGVRAHIVAPLPGGRDVWEASIGDDEPARRLYRGLRTASSRIAGSTDFRSLRAAFDAFKRAFLDEALWSPRQDDEMARCLAALDELDEAASTAGLERVPGAVDAWLEQLSETRYVPASTSGGIAVYRFPVAAGAMPDLHFVVNLAQGAAVAASRPLAFMRADERARLGAADRDLSAGLVRLLARSGGRVFMSYSEDGPDGVRPPHPAVYAVPPESSGLVYERDRWLPNLEADGQAIAEAFPTQAACARAAAVTVVSPSSPDWSGATPDAPATMGRWATEAVRASMSRDGRLRLSATAIEGYASCAFRRVFARTLKVEAMESGLSFIDSLLVGGIYHDAFGRLFRPLAAAGRTIVAPEAAGEEARPSGADVDAAIAAAITGAGAELGPMAAVLVSTAKPALRRDFARAVAALVPALDGLVPTMVDDEDLIAALRGVDADLYGRPDLVCLPPGTAPVADRLKAVIVDYKKSKIPKRAELQPAEDGSVGAIQIPAYTVLIRAAGLEPFAAYYLSVEKAGEGGKGLLEVFGPGAKPVIPADCLGALGPAVEAAAAKTAAIIERGSIYVPAVRDRDDVCEGCELRPVCRARYAVR